MLSSTNLSAAPVSPAGADMPARRSDSGVPDMKMLMMGVISYSATKKVANGCGIMSRRLDAGSQSWRIVYNPNGMRAGTTESISLCLQLDATADDGSDDEDIDVRYKFMFLMPGHEIRFMSGSVIATVNKRQNAHGFERFITRDDLEKSGCLENDYLTIRCDVAVLAMRWQPPSVKTVAPPSEVQERSVDRALPSKPWDPSPSFVVVEDYSCNLQEPSVMLVPSSTEQHEPSVTAVPASGMQGASKDVLSKDLGRLLATKEGADVDFEVSGVVFAAHRCVLAARSSVLKSNFFGPTKEEKTSYIRISNMNPETFEALLHYIYTNSLPEMNDQEVGALAHHLLSAADRFDLKGLKSIMEKRLCIHICVTNALATLVLAEQHQCHKLKNSCFRFIASPQNDRTVMATDNVEHLAKSCPSIVRELVTKILDSRDMASSGQLSLGKEME